MTDALLITLGILLLIGLGGVAWQLQRLRETLVYRSPTNAALEDSMEQQKLAIEHLREQTERSLQQDEPLVVRSGSTSLQIRTVAHAVVGGNTAFVRGTGDSPVCRSIG